MPDDDPKNPAQREVLASQIRRSRLAQPARRSIPAKVIAEAYKRVLGDDLEQMPETATPMHGLDRKLFAHLGIPAAILVGAGLVGLAAIFAGWPHCGAALAAVCFLGAFIMWLRLSETKLRAPPEPITIAVLGTIAVMTWVFIGWQTWLWLHAPIQSYTKAQLDWAVQDALAKVPVGYTQQQVDQKIAAATKTLQERVATLQADNDTLRQPPPQQPSKLSQSGLTDQERQNFENALRYRNLSKPGLKETKIKIYAEASNAQKGAIFADIFLASQWHPIPDSMGNYVLRPDFNISPGITVIRPTNPDEAELSGWQAIREALSQSHIPFSDGMPTDASTVIVAIGQ